MIYRKPLLIYVIFHAILTAMLKLFKKLLKVFYFENVVEQILKVLYFEIL